MYQNLLYAIKRRMLSEIEDGLQHHAAFDQKVKVYHKFPYVERVQFGVVLKNTSATQMRMSADNYLADLLSHVRLARATHDGGQPFPGESIEWVRENQTDVTECRTEDVSSLVNDTTRMFQTSQQILAGPGNTQFATNIGQVTMTIDGADVLPEYINGEKSVVILRMAPANGSKVLITYYARKIVPPGIYIIQFIEDNQFIVIPIYIVEREEVISSTTGTEVTAVLDNIPPVALLQENSDTLYLEYKTSNVPIELVRGTDYSIDYLTGIITFLKPLSKGYRLFADYRWEPVDYYNGPYTVNIYQENHTALPGLVLAIARRAKKDDRQAIIVSKFRESQAKIYGGHWTMSLEVSVIAKDPIQMEEISEQIINWLWAVRKNVLEFEGITLNSVEPTGETEESFVETTGDVYYTTSISINVQSEWQEFVPYLFKIKNVTPNIQTWPGAKNYIVGDGLKITLNALEPDTRVVVKYPVLGYERPS